MENDDLTKENKCFREYLSMRKGINFNEIEFLKNKIIGLKNPFKYKLTDYNIELDDNFENSYGIVHDLKLALDIQQLYYTPGRRDSINIVNRHLKKHLWEMEKKL